MDQFQHMTLARHRVHSVTRKRDTRQRHSLQDPGPVPLHTAKGFPPLIPGEA